ncbi:hypothetical protein [Nocardia spumae]|uniref:hypothetical protein n=1 Tax=Nocardia spumae TaxID=2887190 RepID=UPI001D14240B|nr:hypothetical protein [Nocardia spumae]
MTTFQAERYRIGANPIPAPGASAPLDEFIAEIRRHPRRMPQRAGRGPGVARP